MYAFDRSMRAWEIREERKPPGRAPLPSLLALRSNPHCSPFVPTPIALRNRLDRLTNTVAKSESSRQQDPRQLERNPCLQKAGAEIKGSPFFSLLLSCSQGAMLSSKVQVNAGALR